MNRNRLLDQLRPMAWRKQILSVTPQQFIPRSYIFSPKFAHEQPRGLHRDPVKPGRHRPTRCAAAKEPEHQTRDPEHCRNPAHPAISKPKRNPLRKFRPALRASLCYWIHPDQVKPAPPADGVIVQSPAARAGSKKPGTDQRHDGSRNKPDHRTIMTAPGRIRNRRHPRNERSAH